MSLRPNPGRAALAAAFIVYAPQLARAQQVELPPIVVTATRTPTPLTDVGSDVTVIDAQQIRRLGATTLADVLRGQPGVDVHGTGGVGTVASVSLRGASAGETLVLIDGVRVGDPTSVDDSLNLGNIAVTDIDRIEILRGPQSALYGSDAMGGVINIITHKGSKTPHGSVSMEGGSYGTLHSHMDMSGGNDRWTYAFSVDALHSDGFPRFGYRVKGPIYLSDGVTPLPPLPKDDPTNRAGATGSLTYKVNGDVKVEAGFTDYQNDLRFDNPFAFAPADVFSAANNSSTNLGSAYGKLIADTFGGRLRNQLTVFDSSTDSQISETESCPDYISTCVSYYRGSNIGAEYQGDLTEGIWGITTFGLRTDTERADTWQDYAPDFGGAYVPGFSGRQTTNSAYVQQQTTLWNRLHLTLGGRVDAVEKGPTFPTFRATAAYDIDETGTKLRASVGDGAKQPTLYQRYSLYGDPSLQAERNLGADAGIDQSILSGRATLSATAFWSDYRDLIAFANAPSCTPAQVFGCYYNVGRARTEGLEFSGEAWILPGELQGGAAYTRLIALDLDTGQTLLQHARDTGYLSLTYTGIPKLSLEGRLTYVGVRYDDSLLGETVPLAAYATVDLYADYKLTEKVTIFGRLENLTDARYQEAFDYGTPGRSVYGGLKVSW